MKGSLQTNVLHVAHVLDIEDSIRACLDAGIGWELIVTGKGPFSVEDNLSVIRKIEIGVLVTKDGGFKGASLKSWKPQGLRTAKL